LLNAFAVLWHPVLLSTAKGLPRWHRADEPPQELTNRLIIAPSACSDWLPGGWPDHARLQGAVVLENLAERDELLRRALEPLEPHEIDADLIADFLALGTCYLQIELLTRHMHHFSNLDEVHLQREALAAADAAVAHDSTAAKTHLRACFEILTEARERFYPVDCYLLDICLLIPRLADEHLERMLALLKPVNILVSGVDLEQIAAEKPHLIRELRDAWHRGTVNLIGGEKYETPVPLMPLNSVLWNFAEGRRLSHKLFGRTPKTWGKRRYGFATQLPQILSRHGYHSALHLALDDGIYPDTEQSKIRWEGCDGTILDALTRIPLAADGAASFLRFPQRMAESMEQDQVAAVLFARWPEVKSPWLDDFRRMHNYSPALGRFVTLDDFIDHTADPGRLSKFTEDQYLSPFLIQTVARQEANPISRFVGHFQRRQQFDAALWYRGVARLLVGKRVESDDERGDEQRIEDAGPDGTPDAIATAEQFLAEFTPASARQLADVVMHGAGNEPGFLLLNPLSFPRTVSVEVPRLETPPPIAGPVKAVQFDGIRKRVTADVPGCGFAWIPAASAHERPAKGTAVSMAEENVLRNEFFEVYVNEITGGIRQLKGYGRSPNRLSQQLTYRFPNERTVRIGQGEDAEEIKTAYAEMRCLTSDVTCDGPALGEIVTTGEIVDQKNNTRLAGFRQTFRVWRGRRVVEVDVELDVDLMPDGNPWLNYYAIRFAWNDSTAPLTRSVLEGAHTPPSERFESPHYLEIAEGEQRTTILFDGLPFHRKTGPRMVDTLLIAAGETARRFRFVIAIDENYPLQAARDAMTAIAVVETQHGPPAAGTSGWFFHLPEKNVQIVRVMDLASEPPAELAAWEQYDVETPPTGRGFAVRLLETEGRRRQARLRCFQPPTRARQRDFQGRTLSNLAIEGDSVLIEMTAYEIADVELRFD
jgi:alpha-mannosidase